MSTLTSYTSGTRPAASSNSGLCIFRSDTSDIEVSDGTNWLAYSKDGYSILPVSNTFSGSFDGTNDYIDCGSISTLLGASAQSLSVWFKPTNSGKVVDVGYRPTSTSLFGFTMTTTTAFFNVRNGSNNSYDITSVIPADTNWHHYLGVFNAGTVAVYIDGSLITGTVSGTTPTTIGSTAGDFYIGRFGASSNYADGLIDEVALWDVALDANDALALYNSGSPIDPSSAAGGYDKQADLTHWWRIGDHASDTGSGGNPSNGDSISNVENAANPNTNDGTGTNGPTYSTTVPA